MTQIPPDLIDAIRRAPSEAVRKGPNHDLLLGRRRQVYRAIGKRCEPFSLNPDCVGQLRRANLAIISIEKSDPALGEMSSSRQIPVARIENRKWIPCRHCFAGEGRTRKRCMWQHCDDFSTTDQEVLICIEVGYGAAQVISVALDDEIFDENGADAEITDRDVDPHDLDVACSAASVYANGPVWVPTSDPGRRRLFWEWWLEEAVPRAWGSGDFLA